MPSRVPAFVLALAALAGPAAWANVGPPSFGGQIVGEPTGLRDVHILRETLTIDLRPLADGQRAIVEAVYRLDNRGPERTLDLFFIGGTPATSFDVRFGDRAVPSAPATDAKLPPSWQPPPTTPGLAGPDLGYLQYGQRQVVPQAFALTIPSGEHTLTVRYEAEAAQYHVTGPTITWQFAYVLAPAREWASFGGLDVEIYLPPGWRMACTPNLLRGGDILRGNFNTVPVDAIALTIQSLAGPSYLPLVYGGRIVLGFAGLFGLVACGHSGWWCGRRRRRAWLRVTIMAVLWGLALIAAGAFVVLGPDLAIPPAQQNHYGYGQAVASLLVLALGAAAVPVGFAFGMVCHAYARRRSELYTD